MENLTVEKIFIQANRRKVKETTLEEMLNYDKGVINFKHCTTDIIFLDNLKSGIGYHYCLQQVSQTRPDPEFNFPYLVYSLKKYEPTKWFIYGEGNDFEYDGYKCSNWRFEYSTDSLEEALEWIDDLVCSIRISEILNKHLEGSGMRIDPVWNYR